MKNTKLSWGAILVPTKECVKLTGLVKDDSYAIFLGISKDGSLVLVINDKRAISYWDKSYWKLLPDNH